MQAEEVKALYQIMQKVDFFRGVTIGELEELMVKFHKFGFPKGKKIIRQGEVGDAFYIIKSGRVSVFVKKGLLSKTKISDIGAGGFFGEMALINSEPRTATVIAEEDVEVFVLLRTDFQIFMKSKPIFAEHVNSFIEKRKFELKNRQ